MHLPKALGRIRGARYVYALNYKYAKVKPDRMLLEAFHGRVIGDSPLYVLKELMRTGEAARYEIYFTTKHPEEHAEFVRELGLPIKLVKADTWEYARVLATAKYLVNNSSFPSYFIRREEQSYLQTWHGTPLKTLGKRMRLGMESMFLAQHNFIQASCITFANEFTRDAMMRDYNLETLYTGKVAMVGYPRNSVFMNPDPDAEELRRRYGLDDQTNFAYMPTWRGTSAHDITVKSYEEQLREILAQLDASLTDKQKVYVNLHSMVADTVSLSSYRHIVPFPSDVDTYRFLNQMDCLISDYSSVFFDFSLTRKPIILFLYDMDEYLHDRGLYLDIKSLPFQQVFTAQELAASLTSGSYRDFDYRDSTYEEAFLSYDTPNNPERAVSLLVGKPLPEIPVIDYAHNATTPLTLLDPWMVKNDSMIDAAFAEASRIEADVIQLPRGSFSQGMCAHLHDAYRDERPYLFFSQALPETPLEHILKTRSSRIAKQLDERDRQRVFGHLRFGRIEHNLYTGKVGSAFAFNKGDAPVDLPVLDVCDVVVGDDELRIQLNPDGPMPTRVVLGFGRSIVWARDLGIEERTGRFISDSFSEILTDDIRLGINSRVSIFVEAIATREEARVYALRDPLGIRKNPIGRHLCGDPLRIRITGAMRERAAATSLVSKVPSSDIILTLGTNKHGRVSLYFADEARFAAPYMRVFLTSISARGKKSFRLRGRIAAGDFEVTGATLVSRDRSSSYPDAVHMEVRDKSVSIVIDTTYLKLFDSYWDVRLLVRCSSFESEVPIYMRKRFIPILFVRNLQVYPEKGKILFPCRGGGRRLAFTYRNVAKSDVPFTRVKEWAAFAAYVLLLPYWKSKRYWLVYEKFCALAQDNGYYFFKYCMEQLPPDERKHIFYVIDKDSPDRAKVEPYGKQVLDFMSFRHMLYAMAANIYVGSDAASHLYQWRPRPSVVVNRIRNHKIFFLQHGVTAMKRVANLFGKDGNTPMTYFVSTSKREQDIVVENFGYESKESPICGFARWDALEDKSDKSRPQLLVMPTWRPWLEDITDEEFKQTEYFVRYSSLMKSERLGELLDSSNMTLTFYIHPKLSELIGNFSSTSKHVQLVPMGSRPLNEIMMASSALVTDYSSVCWDMLYMDKPVAYYQFDQRRYEEEIGSYVDLNTDLPGDVCFEEDELLGALEAIVKRDFVLTDEQRNLASEWFDQKDRKNCERTYKFLKKEGY